MKLPVSLALLSLAFVSVSSIHLDAQPAPSASAEAPEIEVASVKFDTPRIGGESWYEAAVELSVRPGGRPVSGQFVDRVRVVLNLGFEVADEKGGKRKVFYRSAAEAVTLEGGSKPVFRFYLPPELVRRDKLRTDADYHAVEIEIAGRALPAVRANLSKEIKTPEILTSFLSAVNAEAGANEGILVPQYLTPFAFDSQRRSPGFIRRESQR